MCTEQGVDGENLEADPHWVQSSGFDLVIHEIIPWAKTKSLRLNKLGHLRAPKVKFKPENEQFGNSEIQ